MSAETKSDLRLEIAHVLFIDIVGYSKLLITEQSELLRKLTEVVRETEVFRLADAAGELVRIPRVTAWRWFFAIVRRHPFNALWN